MTTYARIVNGQAVDVTTSNPQALYHADIAAQFVTVPDGTGNGDTLAADGKTWTKYVAPQASAPAAPTVATPLPKLTPMTFYLAFTVAERMAIKGSSDPTVKEFWDTYQRSQDTGTMVDPNLVSVQEGLAYLATPTTATPPGPGILASTDRIAQILAGTPQ